MTKPDKSSTISKVKMILDVTRAKKVLLVLFVLLGLFSSFLLTIPAVILGRIADSAIDVISNADGRNILLLWVGFYFFVMIFGGVVRNAFGYWTSKYSNRLIKELRAVCFRKMLRIDRRGLKENNTGYFINMINDNTQRMETLFSVSLFTLISDLFDLLWMVAIILFIDWRILLVLLAFFPVIYFVGLRSGAVQNKLAAERINTDKGLINSINDAFANLNIIRLFKGFEREKSHFDVLAARHEKISNHSDFVTTVFFVLEKSIRYIAITVVILLELDGIISGVIALGILITVIMYSERFYSPLTNIVRYIQLIQKALVSLFDIDAYLKIPDYTENVNIDFNGGKDVLVSGEAVSLSYDSHVILRNIDCTFADRRINIVSGQSGSGKTTLIRALLGLEVLSNGKFVLGKELQEAPNLFSYASQDAEIFNCSIIENVLYPDTLGSACKENKEKAIFLLGRVGIAEDDFEKEAGELGANLSGGEKKRISFVRSLMTNSSILILDEVTSNLDEDNENAIIDLILDESKSRSVIFILHSQNVLSRLKDVSQIIKLEVSKI